LRNRFCNCLRNFNFDGGGGGAQAFSTEQQHAADQDLNDFYRLRFLSNVDPVDVRRTLYDLDPEETLVIVISKTFTTAETMLNARTARQWLWDAMGKVRRL
jgi:glucose-6-phosphate isomerase